MARHLEPGGVLVVEPWILPGGWTRAGTPRASSAAGCSSASPRAERPGTRGSVRDGGGRGRGGGTVPEGSGEPQGGAPVNAQPLWRPSAERVERANMTRYLRWLAEHRGVELGSYDEAWRWSVEELDGFWSSIWEWFEVGGPAPRPGLAERGMPGARWFPGARLNHAELALRQRDTHPALLFGRERAE